jgi:O-antigen/teichoic acid export membrane protein
LSISLVNIPVALIALAIAPAMLHRLSGAWRLGDTNSKRRVTQDFLVIAAISIAGYGLLAFIAPTVFPILLGAQWNSAGPLASLLCLPFALSFVVTPFYAILLYSGLASAKLRLDIVLTFAALLALLIPWWNSPRQAIFAWVIVATVHRLADLSLVARSVQMLDRART